MFRPYAIYAYLEETGWKKIGLRHNWMVYEKMFGDECVDLDIPTMFDAIDYPRCYWTTLDNFQKLEGRKMSLITKDIAAAEARLLQENPMAGLETPVGNYTKMEWEALQKEINGGNERDED